MGVWVVVTQAVRTMVFLVKGTGTWVNHLYKQRETYQTKIRPKAQLLHFRKDVNSNFQDKTLRDIWGSKEKRI